MVIWRKCNLKTFLLVSPPQLDSNGWRLATFEVLRLRQIGGSFVVGEVAAIWNIKNWFSELRSPRLVRSLQALDSFWFRFVFDFTV